MPGERHKSEAELAHVLQLLCPLRKVVIIVIDDDYDDYNEDIHGDGYVQCPCYFVLFSRL